MTRKTMLLNMLLIGFLINYIPIQAAWSNLNLKNQNLSFIPVQNSVQVPLQRSSCEQKLMEILQGIKPLLEKNRDSIDVVIQQLQEYISTEQDNPVCFAIANSYLAQMFWQKYENDAYRINQRTQLVDTIPTDMNEWSTNLFYTKTMNALYASLTPEIQLQKVKAKSVISFLNQSNIPDILSLYQVLAEEALDLLYAPVGSGYEQIVQTDPLLFAPVSEFVRLTIQGDKYDLNAFKLRIFQQLLKNAIRENNRQALVKIDLQRLQFCMGLPINDAGQFYRQAIEKLFANERKYETAVLVAAEYVPFLYAESDSALTYIKRKEALDLCQQLIGQYPDSEGVCYLESLMNSYESGSYNVSIPEVSLPQTPISVKIDYINIHKLTLSWVNEAGDTLHQQQAVLSDSLTLVNVKKEITMPALPYGKYKLVSVGYPLKKDESLKKSYPSETEFSISSMATVNMLLPGNQIQILVLNRQSGKPMQGVSVTCYENGNRSGEQKKIGSYKTDQNGLVFMNNQTNNMSFSYTAISGKDKYLPEQKRYFYPQTDFYNDSQQQVSLFTDRSIYRPGQTVFFKGIAYDKKISSSRAIVNEKMIVDLYDVGGKQIATRQLLTDNFGSFSGEFVIPQNVMNGMFRLSTNLGSVNFEVADYKRPTFKVILDKPTKEYVLGEPVEFKGNVSTFNGVNLANAKINYSVSLIQNFRMTPIPVAHGQAITDDQGNFLISFQNTTEKPYQSMPYSFYIVKVAATDIAGETQESTLYIPVGEQASCQIDLTLKNRDFTESIVADIGFSKLVDKNYPTEIEVDVKNMSGKTVEKGGSLRIFRIGKRKLRFEDNPLEGNQKDIIRTLIKELPFTGKHSFPIELATGEYELVAQAKDEKGRVAETKQTIIVCDFNTKSMPVITPDLFVQANSHCNIGEKATIYLGTSAQNVSVIYQLVGRQGIIETQRVNLSNELRKIEIPFKEQYGVGVKAYFSFMKEGKFYFNSALIYKKEPDRKLTIRKDVFRDKLLPGAQEEWRFTILDSSGKPVKAQVLADLYDASLDQIKKHSWYFNPFVSIFLRPNYWSGDTYLQSKWEGEGWSVSSTCKTEEEISLKRFNLINIQMMNPEAYSQKNLTGSMRVRGVAAMPKEFSSKDEIYQENGIAGIHPDIKEILKSEKNIVRDNLQETAFFYPNLVTNEQGEVSIRFTIPQALTAWNLKLLATTPFMDYGQLEAQAETSKEFMVMPNMPRFVRQGDSVCLSSLILNRTAAVQEGTVTLELFKLADNKVFFQKDTIFQVQPQSNTAVTCCFEVPDDLDLIGVRIKAGNEKFSDGEQQLLPILPAKSMITESMPMSVKGNHSQIFQFKNYIESDSPTRQNYRYTVEFTGNPAWYVVQALPGLSSVKPTNSVLAMSSYYVNTLASFIANSDKGIKTAIQMWEKQGNDRTTLLSNLEKNEALKLILLNETPWVLQAMTQTQNMQALSQLFNTNRLDNTRKEALSQLLALQNPDGGFSWFCGMPPSIFQTLNILESFARLTNLGANETNSEEREMLIRAINYVDKIELDNYLKRKKQSSNGKISVNYYDLLWIYVRSSYRDIPFYGNSLDAHKYFMRKYQENWARCSVYDKALLSLCFRRYGLIEDSDKIVMQLRSIATQNLEMGMYWANNRSLNTSSVSEIQAQVAIMNALYEGNASPEEMNQMKLWLLRQKQTQAWESVPATMDAIYGILLTGTSWLSSNQSPIVKVGDGVLHPNTYFAYADTVYSSSEMTPSLGKIEITQKENHPAFGAAYWQYFENFNAIQQSGKELTVTKELYLKKETNVGSIIEPLMDAMKPGDVVVTRLVIRADRNFSYVVLRDQRAACFEPVEQQSAYRWQQGISYYSETKDATTNFFISYLPKGTYVFEYSSRAAYKGKYHNGISSIQCLYAPEYVGNTQGSNVCVE